MFARHTYDLRIFHNHMLIFKSLFISAASSKKTKLDWEARLQIALGTAQGLAYLHHDCSPRIIHRDVKSKNILLDKDYVAHLADFGIAKSVCISKTHTSTYVMGTIGYIDPEYARTSRLNEKSDVYSYGIVLLELLTGKKPVDNECNLHHLVTNFHLLVRCLHSLLILRLNKFTVMGIRFMFLEGDRQHESYHVMGVRSICTVVGAIHCMAGESSIITGSLCSVLQSLPCLSPAFNHMVENSAGSTPLSKTLAI